MRNAQLWALVLTIVSGAAILEAQGKPSSVPVGPPSTPVAPPATPPADPPSDLVEYVCSILPVPYLCD
jgi:hypothetical protein